MLSKYPHSFMRQSKRSWTFRPKVGGSRYVSGLSTSVVLTSKMFLVSGILVKHWFALVRGESYQLHESKLATVKRLKKVTF